MIYKPIMKNSFQNNEELISLFNHLQNKSFRTLISWKGLKCESKHLEIFESVVLSTWNQGLSLSEFVKSSQSFGVVSSLNKGKIFIEFPKVENLQKSFKQKQNPVFKRLKFMEEKQNKLQEIISRVQAKLEKAIEINRQVKNQLSLSKEIQTSKMTEMAVRV